MSLMECSTGSAFALKATLSPDRTLLFPGIVNVRVTTCRQECFGVVGLYI